MKMRIKNVKTLQQKSRIHNITRVNDNLFTVESGTSHKYYNVRLNDNCNATCTCNWGKYHPDGSACSHVQSVYTFINQEQRNRNAYTWNSQEDADRQKRHQINLADGVIITC